MATGIPRCGRCGGGQSQSTARTAVAPTGNDGKVARVATAIPVRYQVNGKRFATLTAAQDYAASKPGSVIRQL